jgi:molybdopterin/thiamine biosynthesis adenylyltransferase
VVLERLAMCGLRDLSLFDPDTLGAVNLVKHPARRSDIGRLKVGIAAEWLRDRNPACEVRTFAQDVLESADVAAEIARASVVVCAVDNVAARSFINELCVRNRARADQCPRWSGPQPNGPATA